MALHKCSVYNLGAAASGKTQYERTILSRFESLDTTDDIVRDIFRRLLSVLPDDNSHGEFICSCTSLDQKGLAGEG